MKLIKVIPSHNPDKKYDAVFREDDREKTVSFGQKGANDFTITKDTKARERYRARHKMDLMTRDPIRAGFLSYYLLWNKPTLQASIADYRHRFGM